MSYIHPDLRVPRVYISTLANFARLSDQVESNLVEALNQTQAKYDRHVVIALVSDVTGWSRGEGEALVEMLLSLPALQRAVNAPDLDVVALSIASSRDMDSEKFDSDLLASRLVRIVSTRSLDLLARGQELVGEFEHSFISARILSDIRPTFASESSSEVEGAIVVHSLRVRYQDLDQREIVLTLDLQDLKGLQKLIERAIAKESALAKMLGQASIPFIRPEDAEPDNEDPVEQESNDV